MGVQQNWSTTPASNSGADSLVNVAENQAPSTVNDSMRAIMAQVKKTVGDIAGGIVTTGSATAFAIASGEVITALADGMTVQARAHTASGLAPTLALDGTAAKTIRPYVGGSLAIGAMISGGVYTFTYYASGDCWLLSGGPPIGKFIGEGFEWHSDTLPPLSLWCNGQAVSRTTYAALFAVIGTTWGAGDGSTTFNVPDDRGRVSAGQDDMGGVSSAGRLPAGITGGVDGSAIGNVGGAASHTITSAQAGQKAITDAPLTVTDPGHAHTERIGSAGSGGSNAVQGTTSAASNTSTINTTSTDFTGITAKFSLTGSDASAAHNNTQPTVIKNKCIFAGV